MQHRSHVALDVLLDHAKLSEETLTVCLQPALDC